MDGRDIKIKVNAKKKDEYGYTTKYSFGLTANGTVLVRNERGKKYRIQGTLKNPDNNSKEWLVEWLQKKGFEVLEDEAKIKETEPTLAYSEMNSLLRKAQEEGLLAGKNYNPTPMIVVEHANPLNDNSPIVKQYAPVMDGVCGFAWVHFPKANTRFVRFLKKKNLGHSGYPQGYDYWVSAFGQSMEKKESYARAFAKVMRDAGFDAYSQSRMD